MIYIKKPSGSVNAEVKLDENTVFYTNCGECGKLVEATEDILEDFTGFLFGSTRIYCEKCSNRENKDDLTMEEKKITVNELTAIYDNIAKIRAISHEMFATSKDCFDTNTLLFRGIEGVSQNTMRVLQGVFERNGVSV